MSDSPYPDLASIIPPGQAFWVFGYGSLMWRPGFAYAERVPALIYGLHRAFCVSSVHHRGTPEQPGVVLGLDRGGSCHGFAFRVRDGDEAATRAYLAEREQMNRVYVEMMRPVHLEDGRRITALAYVVDRSHPQYTGRLGPQALLALIRQGHGQSGACRDYVLRTLEALEALGIADHKLSWLSGALAGC